MSDLERCQAMMLDHLYGLLEPEQVAEMDAFLGSAEGEPLRRQAEDWKRQISAAAKSKFPDLTFTPPPAPPAKPQSKPTMPVRSPSLTSSSNAKRNSWARWAVAASVLAVLLGLGTPLVRNEIGRMGQAAAVHDRKADFFKADQKLGDFVAANNAETQEAVRQEDLAKNAYDEIDGEFQVALKDAHSEDQNEQFITRLWGPERAQPGAPNFWRVETYRLDGSRILDLPHKVEWAVRDQTGAVLFADTKEPIEKNASRNATFSEPPAIVLPISFWEKVKPDSELSLEVSAYVGNLKSKVTAHLSIAQPVFVTHLATDKPLYKQGETVRFRSLTVDRATFKPPDGKNVLEFRIAKPGGQPEPIVVNGEVLRGSAYGITSAGKSLLGPDRNVLHGIACGIYEIPANAPGGEYTLSVVDMTPRIDWIGRKVVPKGTVLETRKFNVIAYKPELFEKTLEFDGKSYGPGDTVSVKITASRTQGGKIKKGQVTADASVDGQQIKIDRTSTDDEGVARLKFALPANITAGQGRITVTIVDGKDPEPITRPIPIVGRLMNVEFFPEGGDLIENVPNRVYFQATTPNGKPADLKGTVTDGGNVVAEVATLTDADRPGVNRGHGMFTFTPKPGRNYFLKVHKPLGIIEPPVRNPAFGGIAGGGPLAASTRAGFELPRSKNDGVVLKALEPVSNADQPIRLSLQTAKEKKVLVVGAYARGIVIDQRRVEVTPGQPVELALNPLNPVGGVVRVTVFEEKAAKDDGAVQVVPVAERLVYRKPVRQLHLDVHPDRNRYNPGSQVGVDIVATTENQEPAPAVVMVAVVNQSVLTMADEKTGRQMPAHFLLASEVKKPGDLEHADFLLSDDPQAATALDLLLGTQGWRRFAEQNMAPRIRDGEAVDRLLVANGQKSSTPVESFHQNVRKVYAKFQPKRELAAVRWNEAHEANSAVKQKQLAVLEALQGLTLVRANAQKQYNETLAKLDEYERDGAKRRSILFAFFCTGLVLIAASCLFLAWRRSQARAPWFVVAAGCFALCAVALLAGLTVNRQATVDRQVALNEYRHVALNEVAKPREAKAFDDRPNLEPERDEKAEAEGMEKKAPPAPGGVGVMPPRKGMMPMAIKAAVVRGGAGFGDAHNADKDLLHMAKADNEKAKRELDRRHGADAAMEHKKLVAPAGPRQLDELEKKLRKRGPVLADGAQAGNDLELQLLEQEQAPGFYVREFSYRKEPVPVGQMESRDDFTETVCWQPVLVLPDNGRMDIHFQLSDSITRYQVLVAGHTLDGRIGATTTTIEARKPFTVDPKTPIEITDSDRIDVPVSVVNDSDVQRTVTFDIAPNGLAPVDSGLKTNDGKLRDSLTLAPNQKGRKLVSFRPAKKEGDVSLLVAGTSDPAETNDRILRSFRVVPDGFPASGAVSDLLEKTANANFTLPEAIKGTLKVQLHVYPTTLADLQTGLAGLLREPGGCFEQTSTANYPNLLILDYLKSSDQAKPELAQRAKEMLDHGYAQLTAFECPDSGDNDNKHGFEWFGQPDQQHQALTAYGLLQFKDLARTYSGKVDPELIKRTQQYLLNQQNVNKDGFKRNERALDTFGRAPDYITNAYIVWALAESDPDGKEGMTDLLKQLETLKMQAKEHAEGKNDPYFLALVANGLLLRPGNGNREEAIAILDRIAEKHLKNGCVEGAKTSITCSGGRDLQIETTALAVLGWLRSGEPARFIKQVKESTKWIGQQRGGYGGFGSTQSTILALKALIEHAKSSRKPTEAGEIRLIVNGRTFKKAFTEKDLEVITLNIDNAEEIFKTGVNEATVEISTKQAYPFSLAWSCSTQAPQSSEKCSVELATKLNREKVMEGESVQLNVSLTNKEDKGQGMAVAIVGLPGGCRLPADLKELTKLREDGKISYFEVRGRELVLYWRSLKPKEQIDLSVGLICEMPGEFTGPASRGYLYYNADHKHWVKPLSLIIAPADPLADDNVASK
jgi:alpha-2-macroglobulin-like protein